MEDRSVFEGERYGVAGVSVGELVFATGMTGYQETLTDPSYAGQIVMQTFPHIGIVGTNETDAESSKIWVAGYIVREPSRIASNFRSEKTLDQDLIENNIVGISNVDTRAITLHVRSLGAMRAGIFSSDQSMSPDEMLALVRAAPEMKGQSLSGQVSTSKSYTIPSQNNRVGKVAV
ncbi:MAG: carbamoyl-phosphate synthase domain-containing protein, partial [Actinomycetales bacterium]